MASFFQKLTDSKIARAIPLIIVYSVWFIPGRPHRWAVKRIGEYLEAMAADPGVTKCPKCSTYFWNEAKLVKCTECGTLWNTENNKEIQSRRLKHPYKKHKKYG